MWGVKVVSTFELTTPDVRVQLNSYDTVQLRSKPFRENEILEYVQRITLHPLLYIYNVIIVFRCILFCRRIEFII
jgi:hypothetical protein